MKDPDTLNYLLNQLSQNIKNIKKRLYLTDDHAVYKEILNQYKKMISEIPRFNSEKQSKRAHNLVVTIDTYLSMIETDENQPSPEMEPLSSTLLRSASPGSRHSPGTRRAGPTFRSANSRQMSRSELSGGTRKRRKTSRKRK